MITPVPSYDPTPLLRVCEGILQDGEISGEEIYRLAEWLNANREACDHWPGNLLVKPLQEIWADGKVNKTEMRRMARLLIGIRKDWIRQLQRAAADLDLQYIEEVAATLDLWTPCVPAIPYRTKVRSHSQPGTSYDVDLNDLSCSCPDWHSVRSRFRATHPNRCCKHILEAYGKSQPEAGWPGWLEPLVGNGRPSHPESKWFVLGVKGNPVLGSTAPREWANVFAPEQGCYERFGYNRIDQRWSYGVEPTGAAEIAAAIHRGSGW